MTNYTPQLEKRVSQNKQKSGKTIGRMFKSHSLKKFNSVNEK